MNNKKKYISKLLVLFMVMVLGINISTNTVKAAGVSVSISLSASSITVGKSVTATVNVSGGDLSAYTIYVTYNSGVLQFNSASGSAQAYGSGGTLTLSGTGGGATSLTFTAIANGSSSISTSGSEAYNINLEQLSISHAGVVVKVETPNAPATTEKPNDTTEPNASTEKPDETTEADDRSSNCNLKTLQISPGTLQPAFSPSVTSYFVQVDEDVTSMVVSALPEDSKAMTQVYGAGLIEPGENTVKITVTAENGSVKVYYIRVVAGEAELGQVTVTIGDKIYTVVNEKKNIDLPEGFTPTTITYKDSEIVAYESPNQKVILVCLMDEEGNKEIFVYDKITDEFSPYLEYSSNFNRYIIKSVPEGMAVPDGFVEKTLLINENEIKAYQWQDTVDTNVYLVYAINLEKEEGFYLYDALEGAFIRYVPTVIVDEKVVIKEVATVTEATPTAPIKTIPEDEGFFTKKVLGGIAIGLCILVALLVIILITTGAKLKKTKEELEDADSMVSQLATDKDSVDSSRLRKIDDTADSENVESTTENVKDSAFVDSAFVDSAFVDSAFAEVANTEDSAFVDSAFSNVADSEDSAFSQNAESVTEEVAEQATTDAETVAEENGEQASEETINENAEEVAEETTEQVAETVETVAEEITENVETVETVVEEITETVEEATGIEPVTTGNDNEEVKKSEEFNDPEVSKIVEMVNREVAKMAKDGVVDMSRINININISKSDNDGNNDK